MELKEMCTYVRPYVCPICGNELLFFVTRYNKLIDYKGLMENHYNLSELINELGNRNITHMKCLTCNKDYIIDFSNGYPTPLTDKTLLRKFGYK